MRVEKILDPSGSGQMIDNYVFEDDEHAFATGYAQGVMVLDDGTAFNVTAPYVAVSGPEQAAKLNDKIIQNFVDNGHPEDIDILKDPETGKPVIIQRPFVAELSTGEQLVGVGTPVGEHPLDYQLGEYTDEQAAAGAEAYSQMKTEAAAPVSDNTKEG